MKTSLLLALFVGLAVARSGKDYPSFRPEYEYQFTLDSQALTGNPHLTAQFSGFRIRTNIRLQINKDYYSVLQCESPEFYVFNEKLERLPTYDIMESAQWNRVDAELQRMYQECLQTPIMFKYEQGVVQELMVDRDEQEWCTNLQRGVITLFQYDLSQQNQIPDVADPILADALTQNYYDWDKTYDDAYRVMEESVDGECESLYTVYEHQDYDYVPELKVNRIRNYENCQRRPSYDEGFFSSLVIDTLNRHNQTGLRSYSFANATLSGERSDFVILNSKQVSRQFYTPLAEETGEIASFSVQEMILQDVQKIRSAIPKPSQTKEVPLWFTFRENDRTVPKHSTYDNYDDERVKLIDELVTEYLSKCMPDVTPEAMEVLHKLMFFLRDCSADDIIQVFTNIQSNIDQTRSLEKTLDAQKMKVLLDVMPTLGRPQLLPVMSYLIKQNIITPDQAATYFNYIALTIKPTVEVIKFLLPSSELFHLPAVQNDESLRQSIILCLATVHHGLTKAQSTDPIPDEEYVTITRQYKDEMQQLYEESSDETDKMTVIKAIGNCGLPDFISFVDKVLNDVRTPRRVRFNAVYAMRRMPHEYRARIHNILLPIFRDVKNERGMRSMAYLAIMETQPSYSTVQNIIYSLYSEKSQEVGAFVYTHLNTVASSNRLALHKTREHVRLMMKQARPFFPNNFVRNTFTLEVLAERMRIGEFLTLYMFDCPHSIFPNGIAASLVQVLYQKEFNLLTTGIRFNGLEEIVNRLLGPKSLVDDLLRGRKDLSQEFLDIIQDLLTSSKHDSSQLNSRIHNIMQKLGVTERAGEEFNYEAYIQILGNEVRYWMGDAKDIVEYIKQNKHRIYERILDFMRQMQQGYKVNIMQTVATETVKVLPTPMGIPVYINQSYCHFARLSGSAKLSGNPFLLQSDQKTQFNFEGTPSYVVLMEGNFGLQLPLLRTGVSIKLSGTVQDDVSVNVEYEQINSRFAVKYQIPDQPRQVVKVESVPSSYIHKIASQPSLEVYTVQATEMRNDQLTKPVTMTIPYESDRFGMSVEHTIVLPAVKVSYSPITPMNGRHYYCFNRKSTTSSRQYIQSEFFITYFREGEESSRTSGHYRSGSRSEEAQEGEKTYSSTKYSWNVKTINTPKQINLMNDLTVKSYSDEPIWDLTLRSSERVVDYSLTLKGKVNHEAILYPKKNYPTSVNIVDLLLEVMSEKGEQSVSFTVMTGDDQSEVKIPVEPFYLYKLRQLFDARDIVVTEGQKKQQRSSYWWANEDNCGDYICRGAVDVPEVREYAYKYNMKFDYQRSTEEVKGYIRQLLDLLRYSYDDNMIVTPKPCQTDKGVVQMVARFASSFEKMHLKIDSCQYDADYYYTARMPLYLRRALTLDSNLIFLNDQSPAQHGNPLNLHNNECSIEQNTVRTFDKMSYELPAMSGECHMLLAKDCSDYALFSVIYGRTAQMQELFVLFENRVVILEVTNSGVYKLKLDDKEYILKEGEKKTISVPLTKKTVQTVLTLKDHTLLYDTKEIGLVVSLNTKQAKILSTPYNSGEVCGLCGDYNGDVQRELTGADQTLYTNPLEFALSYIVPSDQCNVQQIPKSSNTRRQNTRCEVERETLVLNNMGSSDEEEITCISILPVERCPIQCHASPERQVNREFYCVPTRSHYTRQLVQQSKTEPLDLSQSVTRSERRTMQITIPTQCIPRYSPQY